MMAFYQDNIKNDKIEYKNNLIGDREISKFSDVFTTTYLCYKKMILWDMLLGQFRK